MDGDGSISWNVKDVEGIHQVEVRLVSKVDLGVLKFLLEVALLLESVHEPSSS